MCPYQGERDTAWPDTILYWCTALHLRKAMCVVSLPFPHVILQIVHAASEELELRVWQVDEL